MQYMSQSIGWEDCVVLAMCPLGIITIIISAIRVGGPKLLKAMVGRARENMAMAEMELMSSTSQEICEMYNGQGIVRCQGVAPVLEFVCLWPEDLEVTETHAKSGLLECLTLDKAREKNFLRKMGDDTPNTSSPPDLGKRPTQHSRSHNFSHSPVTENYGLGMFLEALYRVKAYLRSVTVRRKPPDVEMESMTNSEDQEHDDQRQEDVHQNQPGASARMRPPNNQEPDNARLNTQNRGYTKPEEGSKKIIVVWEETSDAPNLSLNLQYTHNRNEIRFAAIVGAALQAGILVFFGVMVYHPVAQKWFLKDDRPVVGYAFPLTCIGTILLVSGVFLCALVVESSTKEEIYKPIDGYELRMFWLQQNQKVNDQLFESTALYSVERADVFRTSRRDPTKMDRDKTKKDKAKRDANKNVFAKPGLGLSSNSRKTVPVLDACIGSIATFDMEVRTLLGTLIALSGFIVQFVGLRSMNSYASLTQLCAIGLMTVCRVLLRRGFSTDFSRAKLLPGYELDWLAWRLVNDAYKSNSEELKTSGSETMADQTAVPTAHVNADTNIDTDTDTDAQTDGDKHVLPGTWVPFASEEGTKAWSTVPQPWDPSSNKAQFVLEARRELGKLAKHKLPITQEAIKLARALEGTMELLFPPEKCLAMDWSSDWTLNWPLAVDFCDRGSKWLSRAQARIAVSRNYDTWRIRADDLDACLSLWLYSIESQENQAFIDQQREKAHKRDNENHRHEEVQDREDNWLRTRVPPKTLCLLTPEEGKLEHLEQDLLWWLDKDKPPLVRIQQVPDEGNNREALGEGLRQYRASRIVGQISSQASNPSRNISSASVRTLHVTEFSSVGSGDNPASGIEVNGALATESEDPLGKLYTQHLALLFNVWAAAQLSRPLDGNVELRSAASKEPNALLWSKDIMNLAEQFQNVGAESGHLILPSIISALSMAKKLPICLDMFETPRQKALASRRSRDWLAVEEQYLGLFNQIRFHKNGDQRVYARGLALVASHIDDVEAEDERRRKEGRQPLGGLGTSRLLKMIRDHKEGTGEDILSELAKLYRRQGRTMNIKLYAGHVQSREALVRPFPDYFDLNKWHVQNMARMKAPLPSHSSPYNSGGHAAGMSARDVCHWQPLHYAALLKRLYIDGRYHAYSIKQLLDIGADPNITNLQGYTALHHACAPGYAHSDTDESWKLSLDAVKHLMSKGASVVQGVDGATPLHFAARCGNYKIFDYVLKLGSDDELVRAMDICDYGGRLPIHWAVEGRHFCLMRKLTKHIDKQDAEGWTPLHLAVARGERRVVRRLLELRASLETRDASGNTPFLLACRRPYPDVADVLLKAGANLFAENFRLFTRFHVAMTRDMVDWLLTHQDIQEVRSALIAKDDWGGTPLHATARTGRSEATQALIDAAERHGYLRQAVDARNDRGQTPLHSAAHSLDVPTINTLITADADPVACDNRGQTVLHIVIDWPGYVTSDWERTGSLSEQERVNVLKHLLAAPRGRKCLGIRDEDRQRPVDLARKKKLYEIANHLSTLAMSGQDVHADAEDGSHADAQHSPDSDGDAQESPDVDITAEDNLGAGAEDDPNANAGAKDSLGADADYEDTLGADASNLKAHAQDGPDTAIGDENSLGADADADADVEDNMDDHDS